MAFGGFCASASVGVMVQAPPAPARPRDLHWKNTVTTSRRLEWTDNSTTETAFDVWKCGDFAPSYAVTSTTTATTGTKYVQDVTITNDTKGCFVVLARNASGASAFTPGVGFFNTTRGNCGGNIPCDHTHSTRRIEMLLSKRTETGSTVDYIAFNRGSSTIYNIDFWTNIFGTHLDGPFTKSAGQNTGWQSSSTTGTNQVVVFWCTASSCGDQHWDGLGY